MDTKALRQKILELAIRGKLVPQDPNDEPASVLLERIREQKKQMVKEGKLKAKDIKNDSVIFVGEDNLHYEKFADGSAKCIEDEIPFELPEGWAWCHYADVIELYSGQDLTPDRYNDIGEGIPYITGASNLENGKVIINRWTTTPTTHATIGDLFLTVKGSGVGKMAFCDIIDTHIARQIMALRCTSAITPQYLYIAISAMLSDITAQANGIIPGIRREIVLGAYLPLPPLSEQEKICKSAGSVLHIIDDIDSNKGDLNDIIQITKSKILDLAIRGQLVPQDQNDEPASVLLERIRVEKEELIKQGKIKRDKKESIIFKGEDNSYYEKIGKTIKCIDAEISFEIPNSWLWCRLDSIGNWQTGSTPSRRNDEYYGGNIPWIKTGDLNNGYIIDVPEYITEKALNETAVKLIPADTVLIAMYGATIGKVGITTCEATTNQACCACCNPCGVLHEYLFYYLQSQKENFINIAEGGAQPNISKEKIVATLIPVPPFEQQTQIINKIKIFNKHIESIEKSLS